MFALFQMPSIGSAISPSINLILLCAFSHHSHQSLHWPFQHRAHITQINTTAQEKSHQYIRLNHLFKIRWHWAYPIFWHLGYAPAFPTHRKLHLKHTWDESPWKTKQRVLQRPLGKQGNHEKAQVVVLLLVRNFLIDSFYWKMLTYF